MKRLLAIVLLLGLAGCATWNRQWREYNRSHPSGTGAGEKIIHLGQVALYDGQGVPVTHLMAPRWNYDGVYIGQLGFCDEVGYPVTYCSFSCEYRGVSSKERCAVDWCN